MASAAEQMAANMNLSAFGKATDLKKRIWFTLGALIIFRLGTYIPLPGVDGTVMAQLMTQNGNGLLGMFNMFTGGALGRMTIFALNILPYISASIIIQLMSSTIPALEALKKEGDSGRQRINQYTRYLTVLIATAQAYGIAVSLERVHSALGPAVIDPGPFFVFTAVVTLVGGTVFVMWLGEQITSRGIGNGSSLIIFAGIVANMPMAVANILELGSTGALSTFFIIVIFVVALAIFAFVVFMERAQRRILVQHPKRQMGQKVFGGEANYMPLKVNASGVMPPIFASSLLVIPATLVGFSTGAPGWIETIAHLLSRGQPLYLLLFAGLIIAFSFVWAAIAFNPDETAEQLKKNGAFIPGIRPGTNTAKYFDTVLTRLTAIGAAYLVIVCLLPDFAMSHYALPFYFGGTSLLIIVSVTMDTMTQIQSHLLAHQYQGLLRKGRGKGRK
ncbi:preprotein translocase subunit SecY [Acidocella aminolytica]|jgi:preprotein translocase subunit SecY|uniref:Protein translocase subunit SecY n=1 Tax=Acidocella aminolytica 101 = DSM 11237 TaxID=1120923 RepID=A0A0D6PFQ8_9PROT|nr:preprotein translocase subunit SecY [Acidocella aminolytica]GAN80186.1 preprotein translocase subunit SecY [Acidocella aminolytica 101 = DSM 11237]GBQ37328.1 preprotein translocase subunit SecY [Acidocella aminolytica 101 = DSM 11237]SHF29329.1 protein translocase subunit secY/sec61 alpha [Acidocella aminolytica 101 = DSM 11237]